MALGVGAPDKEKAPPAHSAKPSKDVVALCHEWAREISLLPPLKDQLERGLLVQSATQIMMAASATKTISKMIRCMATSTGYPRIKTAPTLCCGPERTQLKS